jgi:hypothetical protein
LTDEIHKNFINLKNLSKKIIIKRMSIKSKKKGGLKKIKEEQEFRPPV